MKSTHDLWWEARQAHPTDGGSNLNFMAALEHFRSAVTEEDLDPKRAGSPLCDALVKAHIEIEKMLCAKLGIPWAPSGMSIETLLAQLVPMPSHPEPVGYCIRHTDEKRWRTLDENGMAAWTEDPAAAVCFSLRAHADAWAGEDPEDVRIVPVPFVRPPLLEIERDAALWRDHIRPKGNSNA